MPRQARLDAPDVLYHVMIRGFEGRKIFRNDKDRINFLDRLEKLLPMTETACYAWVFMPNHAHFLFRTGLVPLSTLMRKLLTGYDEKYERRYEVMRRGYKLDSIAKRAAEIYGPEPDEIFSRGKQPKKVQARSLFCFWAVSELGISLRELAKQLEINSPGVGYSVERGETIARKKGYRLIFLFFTSVPFYSGSR